MKRFLIMALVAVVITIPGCCEYDSDGVLVRDDSFGEHFIYMKHDYYSFHSGTYGFSVVHDPECRYCKEKNEEENKED